MATQLRPWIEILGDEHPVSFSHNHISIVERRSKGSSIVCDGMRYELPNIAYEDALKMAGFIRVAGPSGATT